MKHNYVPFKIASNQHYFVCHLQEHEKINSLVQSSWQYLLHT